MEVVSDFVEILGIIRYLLGKSKGCEVRERAEGESAGIQNIEREKNSETGGCELDDKLEIEGSGMNQEGSGRKNGSQKRFL